MHFYVAVEDYGFYDLDFMCSPCPHCLVDAFFYLTYNDALKIHGFVDAHYHLLIYWRS